MARGSTRGLRGELDTAGAWECHGSCKVTIERTHASAKWSVVQLFFSSYDCAMGEEALIDKTMSKHTQNLCFASLGISLRHTTRSPIAPRASSRRAAMSNVDEGEGSVLVLGFGDILFWVTFVAFVVVAIRRTWKCATAKTEHTV